jgi:nicotinate-nucleotide pyrophosphorylase (carboxylating)
MSDSGEENRTKERVADALAAVAFSPEGPPKFPLTPAETQALVQAALAEDEASDDVTTIATIVSDRRARAGLVARRPGIICGTALAIEAFRQRDPNVAIREDARDGQAVDRGTRVLFLNGHARGLLTAERVALNFMQRLSGVASLTAQYVAAVKGTHAKILDTRKTTPGWRKLEKYAVRCGGGLNHRFDLAQAVLIKDNHLAAVDGNIALAVSRARASRPGIRVEVECENLDQVSAALKAGADVIMLDNMRLQEMREAVQLVSGRAVVEASGGVNLQTVCGIAQTGVDWISVGSLTHSPVSLDLALDFDE